MVSAKISEKFWLDISGVGSFSTYFLFCLILFFFGFAEMAFFLLFGLAIGSFFVILIRSFYFKDRPQKVSYKNFFERIYASSFPSMHVIRVVLLFGGLVLFNFKIWLFLLFGFFVILVAISRIFLLRHDFLDVFFGVVFGIFLVLFEVFVLKFFGFGFV